MKTTIELDETKLDRIMKMTGISTMKEAVDWSLNEALRIATINHVLEEPWSPEEARNAVDPSYDIIAIRNHATPITYPTRRSGRKPRTKK